MLHLHLCLFGLKQIGLSNQAVFEVFPSSFYPDLLVGINAFVPFIPSAKSIIERYS
jgi:hypothetical protein